jgi:hypothetical protein
LAFHHIYFYRTLEKKKKKEKGYPDVLTCGHGRSRKKWEGKWSLCDGHPQANSGILGSSACKSRHLRKRRENNGPCTDKETLTCRESFRLNEFEPKRETHWAAPKIF